MEMDHVKENGAADLTLDYYNKNASEFCSGTKNIAFSEHQNIFLSCLAPQGSILDFGCGSGRDSKAFLDRGYDVESMDGSEALCRLASKTIGKEVKFRKFQELEGKDLYDGVWACASILHLSMADLEDVMKRIYQALKPKSIWYFNDMTEKKMELLLHRLGLFKIEKMWRTSDVRPGRSEEKWLNLLLKTKKQD